MINRKLIIFTAAFPYGLKETFFENELPFLAREFSEILIIPVINKSNSNSVRNVPSNVKFLTPSVPASKVKRVALGLCNFAPVGIYIHDFFRGKVYKSSRRLSLWFNSLLLFRISYCRFSKLLRNKVIDSKSVLYSYWGEAPLFTTTITEDLFRIVRMHRIDFYEEVNDGYLPIRKMIYNSSNLLLPISTDIKERLIKDYGVADLNKIFIARLGVDNEFNSKTIEFENNKTIRIVSCSRVDPVKRVDSILKAISKYTGDYVIEWHHFGDGMVYASLLDEVNRVLSEESHPVRIELHGWTKQRDLFEFYKNNYIDWFINVSESEGIPVSIMEAMSFRIPVIATDVGATSEIVDDKNGFLLDVDFSIDDLLTKIVTCKVNKDYALKRECAFNRWKNEYRAEKNYNELVNVIEKALK